MEEPIEAPERRVARMLAFAAERLGPASERLLASPAQQVLALSRLRAGAELEDAVLAVVHAEAGGERDVANEFLAYFLGDVLRLGRPLLSDGLRRFLDSGDLAQSVLGDVWRELAALRFDTRASFLALLAQRLRWKAADRARDLGRRRRREDLRVEASPEELEQSARGDSPLAAAASNEEQERLILLLLRLSARDRLLVTLHLRGEPMEALMEATGLAYEAARKALQRALRRARALAERESRR